MEDVIEGSKSVADTVFSQENLSLLLDNVSSPILWLDNKNVLLKLNYAAKKIFQWPERVVGESFPKLCSRYHIDCPLNELRNNGGCVMPLQRHNRNYVIKWKLLPLLNNSHHKSAHLLMGEDITQEVTVKRQYEHIKSYYDDIMHSLPSIVYWKDRDGVYCGGNDAAMNLSGAHDRHDFVGKTDYDFSKRLGWDQNVVDKFRADDIAVTDNKTASYQLEELPFTRPDGSVIYEISNKAPWIDKKGNVVGVVGVSLDVTELVTAEKELKQIAEKNQLILDATADGIYGVDKKGKVTFINPAGAKLIGKPKEDIVGKTHHEIFHQHDDESARVKCPVCRSLELGDEQYHDELAFTREDGSCFPVDVTSTPIRNGNDISGAVITYRDISNQAKNYAKLENTVNESTEALSRINRELTGEVYMRRQIEGELRKSEQRYRMLSAISPVGIFHLDPEGVCRYVNQRGCEMLGRSMENVLGQRWYHPIHRDDLKNVLSEWRQAFASKEPFKMEYRIMTLDRQCRRVFGQCIVDTMPNGDIKGFVCTITDLTKLHEAKELIRQHQLKLAHVSRVNTIGEMASGIAHELNQPLTSIVQYIGGCIQRLQTDGLSDNIIQALERATSQAERAGKIIHRMKNFLRKGESYKSSCDVNSIINEVINILRFEISDSHVSVKLNLSPNLMPVRADQIQMEQVILNIAHNAIEAMRSTQTETQQLSIKTTMQQGEAVKIIISDTGPGISEEVLEKIFSPFFTTKPDGMGIGLSLAHSIIEAHGGRISANTQATQGCQFYITLPIEKDEQR